MYRELRVKETPEGTVVDFAPDLFVVPQIEKQPTEGNPNIKVDLGVVGGELQPLKAYYPPGTTTEEILAKTDVLLGKIKNCPGCERKKRLMLERLRKMMNDKGRGDIFEKMIQTARAKRRSASLPMSSSPPPLLPPEKEWAHRQKSGAELAHEHAMEVQERAMKNVMEATNDAYVAIRNIFVPPVKPVRPDKWLEIVGVRRKG
jgi:hypothetical protein